VVTVKPRPSHGAGEPLQERFVVLDDQQRAIGRHRREQVGHRHLCLQAWRRRPDGTAHGDGSLPSFAA